MSSSPEPLRSLKDLMREVPPIDKMGEKFAELYNMADRAAAIIGSSFIEHSLERTILAKLRPLSNTQTEKLLDYGDDGPLSGFASKIRLAHALGIYGDITVV